KASVKFFVPTVIVGPAVVFAFAVPPKTIGIANASAKAALTARRACLRTTIAPFWRDWTGGPYCPTYGLDKSFRITLRTNAAAKARNETHSDAPTTPDSP